MERHAPVVVIVLVLIALWYVATVLTNAALVRDAFERSISWRATAPFRWFKQKTKGRH